MRSRLALAAGVFALLALGVSPASANHPGGATTDDPGQHESPLLHGSNYSSVEFGGQVGAAAGAGKAKNVTFVDALKLAPFNANVHGDVAGWKTLAFIGKWREACPGTGVDMIDISRPAQPVKIADTRDYALTSMEDMQVVNVKGRDILAIGLQDCTGLGLGTVGLELYDITNPRQPQFLTLFNGEDFAGRFPEDIAGDVMHHGHVHELDLTTTPSGRTLALLSSPNLEAETARTFPFDDGVGDVLIVDISDPRNPFLAGDWGVLQEPALGLNTWFDVQQGGDARTLAHSVRANANGMKAYVSYWDAGFNILDISDPANPAFLGRTAYPQGVEGNAHSVDEARGGNLLVAADEGLQPVRVRLHEQRVRGRADRGRGVLHAADRQSARPRDGRRSRPRRARMPGRPRPPESRSTTRTSRTRPGRSRSVACRFDNKIARAQLAGATGVIVYGLDGDESLVLMGGYSPVQLGAPSVIGTVATIPAVFVQNSTGVLPATGLRR